MEAGPPPPSPPFRRVALEHAALLLLQLVALFVVARDTLGTGGLPLDDAWIHQVIGRTFAKSGTLGYEAGHFGAGATSYAWAALLALNFKLLHVGPAAYATALGAALHVAAGQLFLAALRRDGFRLLSRAWVAALFSCAPNFVWFAVSGMEASLLAALSMGAVLAWGARGERPLLAGLACGALAWTRPEALLLAPLLLVLTPRAAWTRRNVLYLLAPWALALVAYFAANRIFAGHWVPLTLRGRAWMWLHPLEGASRLQTAIGLLSSWQVRLAEYTVGNHLAFWLTLGAAAGGVVQVLRSAPPRLRALAAWGAVHLAVFFALLPVTGHGGRYQPLTPPLFLALAGVGLVGVAKSAVPAARESRWLAFLPVPLAAIVTVSLVRWGTDHGLAALHVDRTEVTMGRIVRRLPDDARVASFDIGGIGFFADRPVFDMGGLVDPGQVPYLKEGTMGRWLRERRITHVILPMTYDEQTPDPWNFGLRLRLLDDPTFALEPLDERLSPPSVWLPGLRATLHCSPRQVLYRIVPRARGTR